MYSVVDGGGVGIAVVRRADLAEVLAKNTRGGARTFGLVSKVLALFGSTFSSGFSASRRWRRPKGAPVAGG